MDDSPSDRSPATVQPSVQLHWYVRQVQNPWKASIAVISCLALVGASIGIGGLTFADQLSISYLPSPALGEVYNAYDNLLQNNPVFINGDIEGILLERVDGGDVLDTDLPAASSAFTVGSAAIEAINQTVRSNMPDDAPEYHVRWYYTFVDTDLTFLSFQYLFSDRTAMTIALQFDDAAMVSDDFVNAMSSAVESVQKDHASVWKLTATGACLRACVHACVRGRAASEPKNISLQP